MSDFRTIEKQLASATTSTALLSLRFATGGTLHKFPADLTVAQGQESVERPALLGNKPL